MTPEDICEICGAPATHRVVGTQIICFEEVLIGPVWQAEQRDMVFCKRHTADRSAWRLIQMVDGKRQWIQIAAE